MFHIHANGLIEPYRDDQAIPAMRRIELQAFVVDQSRLAVRSDRKRQACRIARQIAGENPAQDCPASDEPGAYMRQQKAIRATKFGITENRRSVVVQIQKSRPNMNVLNG